MAYASKIISTIPLSLSSAASSAGYAPTGILYDVAINSLPFLLGTGDQNPYRRQTAQYRKDQVDLSNEPGEHSITGWWVRAQSSFHRGQGIKFYDPSAGELVDYRITDSRGVNVWTKGEVTLLNSVSAGQAITAQLPANNVPVQHSRSIRWGTTNGILLHDDTLLRKIDTAGTVTQFKAAGAASIFAVCDDGVNAYWVTNVGGFLSVVKKPLTGSTASAADEVTLFSSGTLVVSRAVMEFTKERIIACINNSVYEFASTASALPTPLYTHPDPGYVYTSVTSSGPAIYVSGFHGLQSTIQKFTLSSAGVMPTLTSAITAGEFPPGELVMRIFYHLGTLMIGTSRGVRAAGVSDQDGSITYGPLIVETSQACYDFAARDRFVWCATGVDGFPGVIRLDLGEQIEVHRFAYANDLCDDSVTGHATVACAFLGDTSQLTFGTAYASAVSGYNYTQSPTDKVLSGYVTTGAIRFATLEDKVFKTIKARVDNTYGSLTVGSIDKVGNQFVLANFTAGDFTPEAAVVYPVGPQEYLSLKFTLGRYPSDITKGPIFTGYQLKALPAIKRQRLIQYPVFCYDHETDKMKNPVGREGYAFSRLAALELVEDAGDTIRVEDFRTGEAFLGVIEQLDFINMAATDKRFSGFGGILLVTIRSV